MLPQIKASLESALTMALNRGGAKASSKKAVRVVELTATRLLKKAKPTGLLPEAIDPEMILDLLRKLAAAGGRANVHKSVEVGPDGKTIEAGPAIVHLYPQSESKFLRPGSDGTGATLDASLDVIEKNIGTTRFPIMVPVGIDIDLVVGLYIDAKVELVDVHIEVPVCGKDSPDAEPDATQGGRSLVTGGLEEDFDPEADNATGCIHRVFPCPPYLVVTPKQLSLNLAATLGWSGALTIAKGVEGSGLSITFNRVTKLGAIVHIFWFECAM
jgi:hypothetical protein